ncbi:MAG: glycosyltransferase [Nitrospirota bacterium]
MIGNNRPIESRLIFSIENDLTRTFIIGRGNIIPLRGWCYHPARKILALSVMVNDEEYPVRNFGLARRDVFEDQYDKFDPNGYSLNSGFWRMIPFRETQTGFKADLGLKAVLENGEILAVRLGTIQCEPSAREEVAPVRPLGGAGSPLIAISMTTYNPPPHLFKKQIRSILDQSHRNWICIINDDCSDKESFAQIKAVAEEDPRFNVYRNISNLGFYRNIERCLSRVPKEAPFVALSDQDDLWHKDKLSELLQPFDPETHLVYCDMNIVDEEGRVLHDTYWTTRKNNYEKLDLMMIANTITGAASLFRREMLDLLLPFPDRVGDAYHDHFLGCIALAVGKIRYVPVPLHNYCQHSENIIGHYASHRFDPATGHPKGRLFGRLLNFLQRRFTLYFGAYYDKLRWRVLMAGIIRLRCEAISKHKRRILDRFAGLDRNPFPAALGFVKNILLRRTRVTMGLDWIFLASLGVMKLTTVYFRWNRAGIVKRYRERKPPPVSVQEGDVMMENKALAQERPTLTLGEGPSQAGAAIAVENHSAVGFLLKKTAPFKLNVSSTHPRRINILIGIIDFKYFFGGYITVFNLGKRLVREGYNVRMIIVDDCPFEPYLWRQEIQKYQGLEDSFDLIEVIYNFDRTEVIDCSNEDVFMATSWWTAHIARDTLNYLKPDRFIYLTQEYEPLFYNASSLYVLSDMTYAFPYYAIFSTELLRDYHRRNRIGLFKEDLQFGDQNSVAMENAVLRFEVSEAAMRSRTKKKLLFYARPEAHAARNLFEIGLMALTRAIQAGAFNRDSWEFYGIGTLDHAQTILLDDRGVCLRFLPKADLKEYQDLLPQFDIGLSLMLSPHPSLVPIEMCAAGMLVVTNTFANKTEERLKEISSNFIPAEPSLDAVQQALVEAAARVEDYPARIRGARVKWTQSWENAFNEKFMNTLKSFIHHAADPSRRPDVLSSSESREDRMARAYLKATVISPERFCDTISPEDGAYRSLKERTDFKEVVAYLYLKTGRESADFIQKILRLSGKSLGSLDGLLHVAGGYGMITRHLVKDMDAGKVWAADFSADALRFLQKTMNVGGIRLDERSLSNRFSRKFEAVFAESLFEDLAPDAFEAWLGLLWNSLQRNGLLIFLAQNDHALPPDAAPDSSGFTFLNGRGYVRKDWLEGLAAKLGIHNFYCVENGFAVGRDLYVAARKYAHSLNGLRPPLRPDGSINQMEIRPPGSLYMTGWAVDPDEGSPVKGIEIYSDGILLGKAKTGLARPDVQHHKGRSDYLYSGWEFGCDALPRRDPSAFASDRLMVVIRNGKGAIQCLSPLVDRT